MRHLHVSHMVIKSHVFEMGGPETQAYADFFAITLAPFHLVDTVWRGWTIICCQAAANGEESKGAAAEQAEASQCGAWVVDKGAGKDVPYWENMPSTCAGHVV